MSKNEATGNKFGTLARLHRALVSRGRAGKLADHLSPLLEDGVSLLDVGCGYGLVSRRLRDARPDIAVAGIDIVIRDDCLIEAKPYDGMRFPYDDGSVDYVMFVDVLHHTEAPLKLLREASRVARKGIIVKDHQVEGVFAWKTLWALDWAGNRPYDIGLTYNYWTRRQWTDAFSAIKMEETVCLTRLGMYPMPFSLILDRSLHFISKLAPASSTL